MLKTPWSSFAALHLVVILLVIVPLHAQTPSPSPETGGVAGFILDPLDGGVPDVRVFLIGIGTRVQRTQSTNNAGYFEFEKLPVGTYWVTPDVGFVPTSTVTVAPNETVEHRVKMELGHFDIHIGICAECVIAVGNRYSPPESVLQDLERDEERIRNQPVVGPRMPTPDRLFTLPYPEPLRERRIDGRVVVAGRIGTDGFVTAMRVVSSAHQELRKAAIDALKELQWEPARVRGVAIEYPLTITIDFSLQRSARSRTHR